MTGGALGAGVGARVGVLVDGAMVGVGVSVTMGVVVIVAVGVAVVVGGAPIVMLIGAQETTLRIMQGVSMVEARRCERRKFMVSLH